MKNFTIRIKFIFYFLLLLSACAHAQPGKDGDVTITDVNTVLNRYTRAAVDIAAGSTTITVTNINDLNRNSPSYLPGGFVTNNSGFVSNVLSPGDLIIIYQAQGASINNSDTMGYGSVTNYNGAGTYELVYVESVSGNTITLSCETKMSYNVARYVQIIRVPQYNTITVNAAASIVAIPWGAPSFGGADASAIERRRGGFNAFFANNVINNGSINANNAGFRGGTIDNLTSAASAAFVSSFFSSLQQDGAEKGESIAGYRTDYDILGGRYGRGAAANGGGGGNGHNAGGGGGANGGNPADWFRGAGVMNDFGDCGSPGAWIFDPNFIANSNALTSSSGGGHGGYTYSANNLDACTVGPSYPANFIAPGIPAANLVNSTWGGDSRDALGGLGGRPVVPLDFKNQIFFGGGGGAGDGNNNANSDGADGGGIVFVIVSNGITGNGTIQANGENALNSSGGHNDAPGGGGGGGTVLIQSNSIAATQIINANGGNGGSQLITGSEGEGPGGGGGGGVVSVNAATDSSLKTITGGINGRTTSTSLTEFAANGATSGNTGSILAIPVNLNSSICLSTDISINKSVDIASVLPGDTVVFTIEVTNNGPKNATGVKVADNIPAGYTVTNVIASAGTWTAPEWELGNLATGISETLMITATVNATGPYLNTAEVTSDFDSNLTNNTSSAGITLLQSDLSILKAVNNNTPIGGSQVTFTLTANNAGPDDATGVVVNDVLPTGYTFVSAASLVGAYDNATGIWTIGNIANGTSATLTIIAIVKTTGDYENTAQITSNSNDPNTVNNTAKVTPVPQILLPFNCNDGAGYILTNSGPSNSFVTSLRKFNLSTGQPEVVKTPLLSTGSQFINGVGYNKLDNYIYGFRYNTNQIVRIGADGEIQLLNVTGLAGDYPAGDVSEDGVLYLYGGNKFVTINLDPEDADYLVAQTKLNYSNKINDFAFNPIDKNIYAVTSDSNPTTLLKYNIISNTVTSLGTVTGLSSASYGTSFMDSQGNLFVGNNATGGIYRIANTQNIIAGTAISTTLFSSALNGLSPGDGARCASADIAPIANNDQACAMAGENSTINVLNNDIAGTRAIDPSGVRLLDGVTAVTSLTILNQGVFNVNTTTGVLTFIPDANFTGTTVSYIISDINGIISSPATIVVNAIPTVNAGASVCIGSTITLSPTTGGTWISNDTAIATVTNAGVVTGISSGNTTFTFTNTVTNCSATTNSVTINEVPGIPTIVVTGPSCTKAASNILSVYDSNLTYTSSPAGLSVGVLGEITGGVDNTSYTITASNLANCLATSASFIYNGKPQLPQPTEPAKINCWDTFTFDTTTCTWVNNNTTQPAQPAKVNCWDAFTFNTATCAWDVTGAQPAQPTTACYETATFNTTICAWVVTGTQPVQPTTACYETATFNTATCAWDVTGTQPAQPTTACYETATFNTTTCVWDVTGTQPVQPTTACYETATFNTTTCTWDVTGTQPVQPTTACYETATFNTTTCVWDVTGTQPVQPTTACYETATFNTTTCVWDVTGTQPVQPTTACYETATFNTTTCAWDVTGTQPVQPTTACYETATFNTTTCAWVVTGTQPVQPTIACYETATFNTTTCAWDVTGTQPVQPTTACYETASFNTTTCAWDVTGTQPVQPTTACYETATFNTTTCAWDVTGTQPVQPTTACYETATFNTTTCAWVVTGTQPVQPTTACYETATFNTTTCVWVVTGTQPVQPTTACYETATFNTTTCVWDVTGTQPVQPTLGNIVQPTCAVANGSFEITNYDATYTYTANPSIGVTIVGSKVNAPSGTYSLSASLFGCSSIASLDVTINSKICATNDDFSTTPVSGGGSTTTVISNDTFNGSPVVIGSNPGEVILTGTIVPTGLTLNPDGTITVDTNTPSGNYTVEYEICKSGAIPANCATATATVVVVNAIVAANDGIVTVDGINGELSFINILSNDSFNGMTINPSEITISSNNIPTGITLNADGTLDIAPNTAGGNYTFNYQICEIGNLNNCATAEVTVFVESPAIALIKEAVFNDENRNGVANAGETITYSFTIANTGNIPLMNITISDPLPGVILNGGPITLGVGQIDKSSFTGVYTITQNDINKGDVSNQATVYGETTSGIVVNDLSDNTDVTNDQPTVLSLDGCKIKVFNALSLNGDSNNERFYIQGIECYPDNTVEIYNRWGVLVFETNNYDNNTHVFKGFSEGRVTVKEADGLPAGTYYYILKYKDNNSKSNQQAGYLYITK